MSCRIDTDDFTCLAALLIALPRRVQVGERFKRDRIDVRTKAIKRQFW
jgi:hypothetical protein